MPNCTSTVQGVTHRCPVRLARLEVRFRLPPCDGIEPSVDDAVDHEVALRACARVALSSVVLLGSLGLAGCNSVEELKSTVSGWFAPGKFPRADEGIFAGDVPDPSLRRPPENIPREAQSKASKKQNEPRRSQQPTRTVKLPKEPPVSAPSETDRPQGANRQSLPSSTPQSGLRNLWPEPPAPGSFSR